MEQQTTADELIAEFAKQCRVMVLGGVAVIAHGLSRNTFDADVWIEPMLGPDEWAKLVLSVLKPFASVHPVRIAVWTRIDASELAEVIQNDGVIRLMGLDRPLDLFRRPNEMSESDFEDVWSRSQPLDDGSRLPDMIDLLLTKQQTGRDKDTLDIGFLEMKIEADYHRELPTATEARAAEMLGRFLTPNIARAALEHSSLKIRKLGYRYLEELAADGDPFAGQYLREEEAPYG